MLNWLCTSQFKINKTLLLLLYIISPQRRKTLLLLQTRVTERVKATWCPPVFGYCSPSAADQALKCYFLDGCKAQKAATILQLWSSRSACHQNLLLYSQVLVWHLSVQLLLHWKRSRTRYLLWMMSSNIYQTNATVCRARIGLISHLKTHR